MLLIAGGLTDRAVAMRYIESTVHALRRHCGIALAHRLRRFVGRHLALAIGLIVAFVSWIVSRPRRRGPGPVEALRSFFVAANWAAMVYSISLDLPRLATLLEMLEPLAVFKRRFSYAIVLLARNLYSFPMGRLGTVRRNSERLLKIMLEDQLTPIGEIVRRTAEAAARFILVHMAVAEGDRGYMDELGRIQTLNLRLYEIGVYQARICFHRWRGEEQEANRIKSEAELLFVKLGNVWILEAWLPVVASHAYALTHDVLGLKRTIEEMTHLVEQGFGLKPHLELARGEYHRERGDLEQARAALQRSLSLLPAGEGLIRGAVLGALAETLVGLGELDRARQVCLEGAALGDDPERTMAIYRIRNERATALLDAAAGRTDAAFERLERLVASAQAFDNPAITGTLYELMARIKLEVGDPEAATSLSTEAIRLFNQTGNPVLVARGHQLQLQLQPDIPPLPDQGTRGSTETVTCSPRLLATLSTPLSGPISLLSDCRGAPARAMRVLDLLLRETSGAAGYLFYLESEVITLAAPTAGLELPEGVLLPLKQMLASEETTAVSSDGDTTLTVPCDGASPPAPNDAQWLFLVLKVSKGDVEHPVAAAAIRAGPGALRTPQPDRIAELAQALYQAGDVTLFDVQRPNR